jgi:hypothetical protein
MQEFDRLEQSYAKARADLAEFSRVAIVQRYRRAKTEAEQSRVDYEIARIELERHQCSHASGLTRTSRHGA